MKKINNNLLNQIIKFGFVGGLAFIIDYSVLFILKECFGVDVLIAAAIAFSISVIFNYIASVKWVFDVDKSKSEKKNFILFIIFSVIGLLLTEIIMHLGVNILGFNYLIIKIVATAIVMVFNFITRKKFLE